MAIGPGSRGPEVAAHQQRLKAAGFDPGPIDGIWGPRTEAATAAHHRAVTGGGGPPAPVLYGGATPEDLSAKAVLRASLATYGLENLAQWAWDKYLATGSMEQVENEIFDTPEFNQRFPQYKTLANRGQAMSPGEIITMERQYAQIAHSYGLPRGFYDTPDDFAHLMTGFVSPQEFQRRIEMAQVDMYNAPAEVREFFTRHYGGEGDLLAYFIDAERALPILQKQLRTAITAGFAERQGLRPLNLAEAEEFASLDPQEINERINLYIAASFGQPEEVKQELARLYGLRDLAGAVVDADTTVGRLQEQVAAAMTAGLSTRTGYGRLSAGEAERLATVGVTEETFQKVVHDAPLFGALPGSAETAISRGGQMDILTGSQTARDALERKRQGRVAEFAGGGGFAQTQGGVVGLQSNT